MPCPIKIKEFLTNQVFEKGQAGLFMRKELADKLAADINAEYDAKVIKFTKYFDHLEREITIPQSLIDEYYDAELQEEIKEMKSAEREAEEQQLQEDIRAGKVLVENLDVDTDNNDYNFNENFTEDYYKTKVIENRDLQIAQKLGEKYAKAFNVSYSIITPGEAAILLEDSPTPFTSDVSSFFYDNAIYFIEGKFTAASVLHEFAHPLVKGIAFQNPKLFQNLFSQLTSTNTGIDALTKVKDKYPELDEDSDRFKEEAIVTAMEMDAAMEIENVKNNDSAFAKFIQNLIFAIKKVIKALTGNINLKNLSTSTTRDELVNMMLNEDFQIEDLKYQLSLFAEFKKDTEDYIKELKDTTPKKLVEAINKFHNEMTFQIGVLKNSPKKLREELKGKEGLDVLRNIKDYVKGYKTAGEDLTEEELEELFKNLGEEQDDLRVRSLAFINSLTELEVFARRVQTLLSDMRKSDKFMTYDGNGKIQYFKQFMEREVKFLNEVRRSLALDPSNELVKKILAIKAVVEDNVENAKEMTFEFVKGFFMENSITMQKNVKEKLEETIDRVLKAEKFTQDDIDVFKDDLFNKLDIDNIKGIKQSDFLLPSIPKGAKYILSEIGNYNSNKITEETVDNYLRGHVRDLGMMGSLATPMGNVNDMFGSFVNFMKSKLSNAEVKSLDKQYKIAEELQPYLNAVGINHNDTKAIADLVLFIDTVPDTDEHGNFIEKQIYAYLDKFQNWRADRGKLEFDLEKARTLGKKDEIKAAMQARWEFDEKYMQRKYVDAVYDVKKMWRQDNVLLNPATGKEIKISASTSIEAYMERQSALDDLATFNSSNFTELDDLNEFTPSKAAKIKYDELFNMFNLNGEYKQGKELEKVLIRRAYREQSRKFNESTTNIDKVQKDLDHFVNVTLAGMGITKDSDSAKYESEIAKFTSKNFKIAYTNEYFQERNATLDAIKKINEKTKGSDISKQLANLYEQRYNLVNRVTDKDGEPNGLMLGQDQIKRLKSIEEEIVAAQEQFDRKTGLSKEDSNRLKYFEEEIIGKGKFNEMTPEDKAEYQNLSNNRTAFGLSGQETTYLRGLYRKLNELTDTQATDYYITAFNNALGDADVPIATIETADNWINSNDVMKAKAESSAFAEWFDRNHYTRPSFDQETGEYMNKYYRLKAWTISKPSDSSFYKKTELVDPTTGDKLTVDGVPIAKYSYTKIKDEFFTGYDAKTKTINKKVGVHVDNRGNFLPKTFAIGDVNDKYMNKKYFELQKANNAQYKLLEKLKQNILDVQEDSQFASRMYLDFARFRIDTNLEYLQKGKLQESIKDKKNIVLQNLKAAVTAAKDDPERSLNFDNKYLLVPTDLQGKPIAKVPIRGLFNLDINTVSTDVFRSMFNYMYSIDQQNALIENEPLAQALLNVYRDPDNAIDKLDRASKTLAKIDDKASSFLKRSTNKRLQLAEDFINRTFYGQITSEFQQENVMTTKIAKGLVGQASRAFYALNLQSSVKNKWGMTVQKLIYSAGGKYIDYPSMARGQISATKAMFEYAAKGAYAKGMKSLPMQMMDKFDMNPGKTKSEFGKSTTRTAVKDLLDGAWMYSDRKLLELEGALELGFAVMEKQLVDQVQDDGSVTQIRYADAFETNAEGKMVLKKGIDPEWGTEELTHTVQVGDTLDSIAKKYHMTAEELKSKNKITELPELGEDITISTNKKFNDVKLIIASVNKKLNGTMTNIDGPAAEKYLLYNLFSFSRKYATGMFLQRFQMDTSKGNKGNETWDWDTNDTTKGTYIEFLQLSGKLIKGFSTYWPIMKPSEKAAAKQVIMEGMLLFLIGMVITYLFGYDQGDEDRFAKIKAREDKYGAAGFMANHLLYQLMMVKKENQSFIPLPGVGLNDWLSFGKATTIVIGPTLGVYGKIFVDLGQILIGSDKATYKQDVGPYSWQKQDVYKIWNHIGSLFGVSGKNVSPYWSIKKKEIFENMN